MPDILLDPEVAIFIALAVALAVVTGYAGLRSAFRPYTTSVMEAISSGRSVQLAGFLGSTGYRLGVAGDPDRRAGRADRPAVARARRPGTP